MFSKEVLDCSCIAYTTVCKLLYNFTLVHCLFLSAMFIYKTLI